MADVNIHHEIDCDEETFFSKILFDEGFNKRLYLEALKFPGWKVVDSKEDDAKIARRVQVDPPSGDLPGPIKKVLGDSLAYTEEGTFDKKTKRYAFKVIPNKLADKMKFTGELWVEKIGDKKLRRNVRVSVEVKVFVVGGMIEDRIIADLKKAYDDGARFTNQFIKENGL